MDGIEVITEHRNSTLLDEYERLSVEIQLNQAMLRRSLSEPGTSVFYQGRLGVAPPLIRQPVQQGKRGSWSLHKMLKKLLRPIFITKKSRRNDNGRPQVEQLDAFDKDRAHWKRFSRSVRV
ncbi:hypothetical protein RND81_08G215000 [Saponaria officinalis]|uniref:Uncharacterized protein n=1 Tax=Saponaria officinalis TaxID=3572 RepID=A0AAW1JAM1_SAPOF